MHNTALVCLIACLTCVSALGLCVIFGAFGAPLTFIAAIVVIGPPTAFVLKEYYVPEYSVLWSVGGAVLVVALTSVILYLYYVARTPKQTADTGRKIR